MTTPTDSGSVVGCATTATNGHVARARGLGPVGLAQLRAWLGHDQVLVKPVLDLAGHTPVDAYEIPADMAAAMEHLAPFEVFPWGTRPTHATDLDHTVPFDHGAGGAGSPGSGTGPPGPTRSDNLGPLSRHHHRAKTFGGFACYQPLPGLYLWRAPTGHWYRVDTDGTTALGRGEPEIITQLRQPPVQTTTSISWTETAATRQCVDLSWAESQLAHHLLG